MRKNLFSIGSDAKTIKGEKFGFLTGILYLAPANQAGLLSFVCDTIYSYADDNHYETALVKAGKELNLI